MLYLSSLYRHQPVRAGVCKRGYHGLIKGQRSHGTALKAAEFQLYWVDRCLFFRQEFWGPAVPGSLFIGIGYFDQHRFTPCPAKK